MTENKLRHVIMCNGDVNLSTFARELSLNENVIFSKK